MKGIALIYALIIMFVSVLLIAAAIILSTTELRLAGTIKIKTRKFDAAESGVERYANIFATPFDVHPQYTYNVQVGNITEQVTITRPMPKGQHAPGYTISVSGESKPIVYLSTPVVATVNPGPSGIQSILNTFVSYGPLGFGTGH